jgi:hypothetical protein
MSSIEKYNAFSRLLIALTFGAVLSKDVSNTTVGIVGILWFWLLSKADNLRDIAQIETNQNALVAVHENRRGIRKTIHEGLEDGVFTLTKDTSPPFTGEEETISRLMTNSREAPNRIPIAVKIDEKIYSTRPPTNYSLTEYAWLFARNPGPGKYDTGRSL